MVPYKTFPYMGCPYMPKIHIWLAYMHVMHGPTNDFFTRADDVTAAFQGKRREAKHKAHNLRGFMSFTLILTHI